MEAAIVLDVLARKIPFPRRDLRSQLLRASASIPLNIAEGASEYSLADKAKFFRIARRSAAECAAILELLEGVHCVMPEHPRAHELLREVGALVSGLIHRPPSR